MRNYIKKINSITSVSLMFVKSFIIVSGFLILKLLFNDEVKQYLLDNKFFFITVTVFIVILVIYFIAKNTVKNSAVNLVDADIIIIFLSLIVIVFNELILSEFRTNYTIFALVGLSGICLIFFLIRTQQTKNSKEYGNLKDLDALYNNKIPKLDKCVSMVFEEKDVCYDLLDTNLHNEIYETIQENEPQSKLVIGLEGPWGSGKTTVLNLLKKLLVENNDRNSKCVIIDDFDPWNYNDERSMYTMMYEKILSSIKLGVPNEKLTRIIKKMANMVFDNSESFVDELLTTSFVNPNELDTMIDDYLAKNGYKIVFFIDNIDRVQNDQIFFVYKAVASLIRVNHAIFVLSYDKANVHKALHSMQIDPKYIDKIIQVKYEINHKKGSLKHVIVQSLKNLISLYNFDPSNTSDSDYYELAGQFNDLREFKLYLNKLSSYMCTSLSSLNMRDFLFIMFIKLNNNAAFELIRNNREFFISEEVREDQLLSAERFNTENFEQKAKEFYESIKAKPFWKRSEGLVLILFPAIKKLRDGLSDIYNSNGYDSKKANMERRISSAKYFPVYIDLQINNFIIIENYVNDLFENFKQLNSVLHFDGLNKDIRGLDTYSQIILLEYVQLLVEKYDTLEYSSIIRWLLSLSAYIDDSMAPQYGRLDPHQRLAYVITYTAMKLNFSDYQVIVDEFIGDYKFLFILRSVSVWLSEESRNIDLYDKVKFDYIHDKLVATTKKITSSKINLYDSKYYSRYNTRVAEWILKDNDIISEYYDSVINKNNICKFLYDFTTISVSSEGYGYTIDIQYINKFIKTTIIENLLSLIEETTDNLFVKDLYEKSKNLSKPIFYSAVFSDKIVRLFKEK